LSRTAQGKSVLPAKQVFALTGYHPDFAFIESLGVKLDPQRKSPHRIRKRWKAMCREFI